MSVAQPFSIDPTGFAIKRALVTGGTRRLAACVCEIELVRSILKSHQ